MIPAKLDAMEVPAALRPLRYGPAHRPWKMIDGTSLRPGYHMTPQKLFAAYRQAEQGQPMLQCDAFEDILENDGHLRGQYEDRIGAVAFREWSVRPGGKEAIDIECATVLSDSLQRSNMLALLWHLTEALGFGYAGANIVWGTTQDMRTVIPTWFLLAWQRRFLVSDAGTGDLTFRTVENQWPGEPLLPGEWIISRRPHRRIVRAGAFRTTSWWALFKRLSVTDWIVFAEKFGIPVTLGYYKENASPESRTALLQAVQDVGDDGQAVLSELTKIVIESAVTRSGDVSHLHPAVIARCDAEISKVITGATLNVETGGPGSFALGKVHEGRANLRTKMDAIWLQDEFGRQVVLPFLAYNPRFAKAKPPRLYLRVQPDMSPEIAVKVFAQLQAMGVEIEAEEMYEFFGLRRPDGGDVLKPLYAAAEPQAPRPAPPGGN